MEKSPLDYAISNDVSGIVDNMARRAIMKAIVEKTNAGATRYNVETGVVFCIATLDADLLQISVQWHLDDVPIELATARRLIEVRFAKTIYLKR